MNSEGKDMVLQLYSTLSDAKAFALGWKKVDPDAYNYKALDGIEKAISVLEMALEYGVYSNRDAYGNVRNRMRRRSGRSRFMRARGRLYRDF